MQRSQPSSNSSCSSSGALAGEDNTWLPLFEIGCHYRMGPTFLPLCGQDAVRQLSASCHLGLMLAPIAHESEMKASAIPLDGASVDRGEATFGRCIIAPHWQERCGAHCQEEPLVVSRVCFSQLTSHAHDIVIMYASDAPDASDRHRQTQTDTDKHRQAQTDTYRNPQTQTPTDTDRHRQTQTGTDRRADRETGRQTDRQADKQSDIQADTDTDRAVKKVFVEVSLYRCIVDTADTADATDTTDTTNTADIFDCASITGPSAPPPLIWTLHEACGPVHRGLRSPIHLKTS